jgi:hypothetical protein
MHNDMFHYLSPNKLVLAKYNRMKKEDEMGMVCSTHGGQNECIRILVGYRDGNKPLERLKLCGRIILKWILKILDAVVWTGLIWLRIVISGGLL